VRTDLIIVLLGAPGSGKGTQAQMLAKRYNIPHISTGDIFRYNIKNETSLGIEAKMYIDKGLLVPDILTCNIVNDRVQQDDCKNGFILDGFPRTLPQAEALEVLMKEMKISLDRVISLNVPDGLIVGRITGRRVCPKCGASFHMEFNPPKVEGICDYCGDKLVQRKDDTAETLVNRLVSYHAQTAPLFDFYTTRGIMAEVDGTKDVSEVKEDILKILG